MTVHPPKTRKLRSQEEGYETEVNDMVVRLLEKYIYRSDGWEKLETELTFEINKYVTQTREEARREVAEEIIGKLEVLANAGGGTDEVSNFVFEELSRYLSNE